MVYSKMAASMVQRCVLFSRSRLASLSGAHTGKRFFLSPSYIGRDRWATREKDNHNLAELSSLMDRTYERNLPVSSLTIARFIDSISCREEIDQAEYYLYKLNSLGSPTDRSDLWILLSRVGPYPSKALAVLIIILVAMAYCAAYTYFRFRHSPNCWYLRNWTIHNWIQQCLQYGAEDKALYTLKNKVQYGIFPCNFTFNILLDTFINKEDYESAVSVVTEVMLQESFEDLSTQILSLYTLYKYLSGNPELKWHQERNIGASLLLAGLKQENTVGFSSQLYGYALIGKVEICNGLRAVYNKMPLMWTPGYFGRALNVMEKVALLPPDIKICKDAIDILAKSLDSAASEHPVKSSSDNAEEPEMVTLEDEDAEQSEADLLPEYLSRFEEVKAKLESLGKTESESLLSLTTHLVHEKLPECERRDTVIYEEQLKEWGKEQNELKAREKAMKEKAKLEFEAKLAAQATA